MNQIDLKLGGRFLELGDAEISIEIITDFFSDQVGPGIYSFPFSIPKTPSNRRTFGYTDLMESTGGFLSSSPIEIHLFGNFWKVGILSVAESTSAGFFDCDIVGGAQSRITDFLNTPLRSIDFGAYNAYSLPETNRFVVGYFSPSPGEAIQIQIGDVVSGHLVLFTYNQSWDTNILTTVQNLVAALNSESDSHKGHAEIIDVPPGAPAGIFVKITTTLGQYHYRPRFIGEDSINWNPLFDSLENDSPIQSHMLNVTKEGYLFIYEYLFGAVHWRFPMIYAPNFYNGAANDFPIQNQSRLINAFDAVLPGPEARPFFLYLSVTTWASQDIYPACPMPFLPWILEQCLSQVGLAIDTDLWDDPEMASLILLNLTTNDEYLSTGFTDDDPFTVWSRDFDFRKFMPDLTVGELLGGLKNLFTLEYNWNFELGRFVITKKKDILSRRKTRDITSKVISSIGIRRDDLGQGLKFSYDFDPGDSLVSDRIKDITPYRILDPVESIGDLPTAGNQTGDVRKVNKLGVYFLVDPQGLSTWDYISDALSDFISGDGSTQVSTPVTPAFMVRDVDKVLGELISDPLSPQKVLIPAVGNQGNSTYWSLPQSRFGARIAFYRGLQDGIAHSFHSGEDLDALPGPKVYPMAGIDVYDYYGVKKWEKALSWDGDNGLVATFGREYLEFYQRKKPIYVQALFSIQDFLDHAMVEHYRIESTDLLPARLNFTISNKSDSIQIPVLLDLYKR